MMTFEQQRRVALAILNNPEAKLSRRAGSFAGQCAVDDTPLSDKPADWLEKLADRAGVKIMEAENV